jgi:lysophospholipase L1-like esterase
MKPIIEDGARVLFQGDSITDAGRGALDPENLGSGYAMMAASWFSAAFPEKGVTFINRGISGNRVADLERRWERDCIALRPDWVSIMIGINDTWRAFDSNDHTSTEAYEASYRAILNQACDNLGSHLVLIEPFVLPVPEDRIAWRADLDPRIQIVRTLADEFDAILVPLDGIMNAAAETRDPAFWAPDGVHPTPAGHALIAQSWLRAVKAIG